MIALASTGYDSDSASKKYTTIFGTKESANKLLSIPVSGVILGDKGEDPFSFIDSGITYGYEVKRELSEAANDSQIKGVILEINSPGGTIYGSKAIADGVRLYKTKTQKPVITHISGLSASGGYWSAIASDLVTADYGSTIGSIGVIFGPFKFYDTVTAEDGGLLTGGVVTQKGIETIYFTAGKSKDLGNPYRKLTSDEIQSLQQTVNNEYDSFVDFVSLRRNISKQFIRNTIGALVYDNKTARQLGLIDDTMSKESAYQELAQRSNLLGKKYQVIKSKKELGVFQTLLESLGNKNAPKVSSCSLSSLILAYHGNVTSLCD